MRRVCKQDHSWNLAQNHMLQKQSQHPAHCHYKVSQVLSHDPIIWFEHACQLHDISRQKWKLGFGFRDEWNGPEGNGFGQQEFIFTKQSLVIVGQDLRSAFCVKAGIGNSILTAKGLQLEYFCIYFTKWVILVKNSQKCFLITRKPIKAMLKIINNPCMHVWVIRVFGL